jgi:hypothetical protein
MAWKMSRFMATNKSMQPNGCVCQVQPNGFVNLTKKANCDMECNLGEMDSDPRDTERKPCHQESDPTGLDFLPNRLYYVRIK